MVTNKIRFQGLDLLRFYLASYLVLFHTLKFYPQIVENKAVYNLLDLGGLATSCFFVLSGFMLTHVYIKNRDDIGIRTRSFLIARLSALYPLHLIEFILIIPSVFNTSKGFGNLVAAVHPLSGELRVLEWPETIANIVNHLTLTQAWNPFYIVFNGPSWSISALLFFYLVFPYVGRRLYKVRRPAIWLSLLWLLLALPGFSASFFGWFDAITYGVLHRNPIVRLPLFLAGIVLYSFYSRRSQPQCHKDQLKLSLFLALVVVITIVVGAYMQAHSHGKALYWVTNGFYFPASLSLVWIFANLSKSKYACTAIWSARLGRASLTVFLLHIPMFLFLSKCEDLIAALISVDVAKLSMAKLIDAAIRHEQVLALYPIYFVAIIMISVLVQEKVVERIQYVIKERFIVSEDTFAASPSTTAEVRAAPI